MLLIPDWKFGWYRILVCKYIIPITKNNIGKVDSCVMTENRSDFLGSGWDDALRNYQGKNLRGMMALFSILVTVIICREGDTNTIYVKGYQCLPLKNVHFIVCQSYLNKVA